MSKVINICIINIYVSRETRDRVQELNSDNKYLVMV